jgi:MFS family permease
MFSSLKVKYFRFYWLGMFVSLVGTWIQTVVLSWLVFQLTNSSFLLGVVGFLATIPVFVLSVFGGVLADRTNKRNILICTQGAFMFLAILLAILTQLKLITTWQIMSIALFNGVIMAFDAPARQSIVVELVGKNHLFNAIALNSVAFNSSRIIGPAIAGVLVAIIGMSGCFYLNAASFLAVIIALFYIKFNHTVSGSNNSAFKDVKAGLVFVNSKPVILALMSVVGAMSIFGVSYILLMPVFASHVLGVGLKGLGGLMSSSGLGALVGALGLARLGDFKFKGKFLIYSVFLFSASLILFSLSKSYPLSILALVLVGSFSVVPVALVNTLLQVNVPDAFRGRVMSLFMITFAGMVPFGNLISGVLAQSWGVSSALFICGLICAILFTLINFIFPGLKEL